MAEFQLIERYFSGLSRPDGPVALGVGDDCALLDPPPGQRLAMTMDTLIAGRHFLPDADPFSIGHKSLAVNLSDLAAMGASPAWALLSLSLPQVDDSWLSAFTSGFAALAEAHGVALVGGDTCQGSLSITLQLTGFLAPGQEMLRSAARPGDAIYVTGTLGDAALALQLASAGQEPGELAQRLDYPDPRVAEGRSLSRLGVKACIDISDGLVADLGHICRRSSCGARVYLDSLPLSSPVREYLAAGGDYQPVVAGGDDYELCFTVPPALAPQLRDMPVSCIGEITAGEGVELWDGSGKLLPLPRAWEHFSS
ncbi:thiamine-phosphate kinase [Thiolapillus brandeum]|uniref:Thiamine-monophosphate kinase n=1 Tax=Thiolapillus brandeum TaxID=1076588 RepID=A0A7U6JHK1_9GAMM|nr:thiamine-phosphate kinase [Thiolapillus brandeum]BAO43778.1 thiamine-monophosphate kinase [Thiolapillus brandeum]